VPGLDYVVGHHAMKRSMILPEAEDAMFSSCLPNACGSAAARHGS
jgi:hypothetical protein